MPKKKVSKNKSRKLDVRVLYRERPLDAEDLLPESQEFLMSEESGRETADIADKEERYKRMVMWSGISFFMVVILIAWVFNMKEVFRKNSMASAGENKSWEEFSTQMKQVLEDFNRETDKFRATSTPNNLPEDGFSAASIKDLKDLLVSTSTATSTASSTETAKKK